MSLLVKLRGTDFIKRLFPPIVIGPVIILIGLSLAGSGVKMASENWLLALISLITAVVVSLKAKGLLKLIPIFCGIIVGYLVALFFFDVDTTPIKEAAWFAMPQLVTPKFSWEAIIYMLPVAIAPVIEHIGDVYAVNSVAGKDFIKNPGLHRTLLGDGIACAFAGLIGGPPVTTYSEVTGGGLPDESDQSCSDSYCRYHGYHIFRLRQSECLAKIHTTFRFWEVSCCSYSGRSPPWGMNNLIQNKVDLSNTRNMIIVSLILTFGIGGAAFEWGNFSMSGIGLAALLGVVLNLVLPMKES